MLNPPDLSGEPCFSLFSLATGVFLAPLSPLFVRGGTGVSKKSSMEN